jgi:peptidoglycan-associated lipoprotein
VLKRFAVISLVICVVAFLSLGCQRRVVIEGGAEGTEQPEATGEQPQPLEGAEDGLQQDEIEASLQTAEYPGIEGQVFESSMLKDIHFAFDRYDLGPKAREILAQNAEFMLSFPAAKIQVEGHCDERGTSEYNLALGERRAMSTKRYLVSLGVPADRLSTISYGEELRADPGHNEAAWSKNRRAHFIILSK